MTRDHRRHHATLCDTFAATAAAHADEPALRTRRRAVDVDLARVRRPRRATPPRAFDGLGVRRGDTVALWLSNRPEFHVADTAAMQLGAAPFSVYSTFTVEQAEHVVGDAGSRVLVTEPAYLERALAVRERRPHRARADRARRGLGHQRAELGRAACRRPGGLRPHRGRGRGLPGRPRDAHLHLGDDRSAEGRRAHASQRRGAVRRAGRGARARSATARDLLAADGAYRRAAVHPLHPDAASDGT